MPSVCVFGGTGYLGSRIARQFVNTGYRVVVVGRGGGTVPGVEYARANVFEPESYRDVVLGADVVVHSIGVLLENPDYKRVVARLALGLSEGLCSAVDAARTLVLPNPMAKDPDFLYQRMNCDSALVLAKTVAETRQGDSRPAFVYISADRAPPLVPAGYISLKRQAETALMQNYSTALRPVLIRPGMMYDGGSGVRNAVGHAFAATNAAASLLGLPQLLRPAVDVDAVARLAVRCAADPLFTGVVVP